jgi:hypothetical protein
MKAKTRKPARYHVRATDANRAILEDRENGFTTEFWAPGDGGYVRAVDTVHPGTLGRQVCDELAHQGTTLHWAPKDGPLAKLIRVHARRYYRAVDRQFEAR